MAGTESEGVEVQVLGDATPCIFVANGAENGIMPSTKTVPENAGGTFDDASTARTEMSTEVDDMSSLRENLTYGSLYMSDGGTFLSPANSFDGAQITRARSIRVDHMLSSAELDSAMKVQESRGYKKASLMDLDDDDDDYYPDGIKTTLGNKLSIERRVDRDSGPTAEAIVGNPTMQSKNRAAEFYGAPSFVSPSSIAGNALQSSDSRTQFYAGYSQAHMPPWSVAGDALHTSGSSRAAIHGAANASTGSMLAVGTDQRIGFYRVECSDTAAEPLTCREKLVQVSCMH